MDRLFLVSVAATLICTVFSQGIPHDRLYRGCYDDKSDDREFNVKLNNDLQQTVVKCIAACRDQGFSFAGLQNATECWCGNSYGKHVFQYDCDELCPGDTSQVCGHELRNSIYATYLSGYYMGCYDLDITTAADKSSSRMTPRDCVTFCAEQKEEGLAAVRGGDCFCVDRPSDFQQRVTNGCNNVCGGIPWDTDLRCGGTTQFSVYYAEPIDTDHEHYLGCYVPDDLSFEHTSDFRASNLYMCINLCSYKGYMFAGAKSGHTCICGNEYNNKGSPLPEAECKIPCRGVATQTCGGINAGSIYRTYYAHCSPGDYSIQCDLPCPSGCNQTGDICDPVTGVCYGCQQGLNGLRCMDDGMSTKSEPATTPRWGENGATQISFSLGLVLMVALLSNKVFC